MIQCLHATPRRLPILLLPVQTVHRLTWTIWEVILISFMQEAVGECLAAAAGEDSVIQGGALRGVSVLLHWLQEMKITTPFLASARMQPSQKSRKRITKWLDSGTRTKTQITQLLSSSSKPSRSHTRCPEARLPRTVR